MSKKKPPKTPEQILEKLGQRHRMYRRDIFTMERCLKEWRQKVQAIEAHMDEIKNGPIVD